MTTFRASAAPAALASSNAARAATELPDFDAAALARFYRQRTVSPIEVTEAILKRIEALQPTFNAYRHVDAESALAQAKASENRWAQGRPLGPLDGIPVAFKDLLHVRGWPTRKGSLASSPACQTEDAPAAARLRETGAVFLGKTQTAEYGWKGLTETRLAGITRNAWNPDYASGGSSGGAAVAAALGLGPLQVGTDGGGSIRQPAAVNGVFGFKPTYGRVAGYPAALNGNLFHIGPLTRSVRDAALLLNVIAAPDPRDWTSLPADGHNWLDDLDEGNLSIKGLRVAYARTLFKTPVDAEIATLVDRAVARLGELGAIVEAVDPPIEDPTPILSVFAAERAARLQREIGDAGLTQVDPEIKASVLRAQRYTIADLTEAQDRRAALAVQMRRFHQRYALLLTPVQSQPVPLVGTVPQAPFLAPFNLTQQPAASLPIGVDSRGLPVALQIVGAQYADAQVLRVARAFERAQPFSRLIRPQA
jgi:aspartyl-tRNA(Asn)/glutamyl-tRNA(Gln) amidotransferase subunit A